MTTTDSCSYNTPGSVNGWHSPDTSSYQNGAISKNYQNGFHDKDTNHRNDKDYRSEKDNYQRNDRDYRNDRDEERRSRSPKNINLSNGIKNINISNGVIPKKMHSRQNSNDGEMVNGHDRKGVLFN